MNARDVLISGATELGLNLTPEQIRLFLLYLSILQRWNKKINLTSVKDEKGVVTRHFLDSLAIHDFVRPESRLLDIGSGAGFPGVPIKIVIPSIEMTLLDATQKKVFFLSDVIRQLGLKMISAVWGRAESDDNGIRRHYYDYVVSRAVGTVDELVHISEPYLVDDGRIILMRGKSGLDEWSNSKAVSKGLRLLKYSDLLLPHSSLRGVILLVGR